MYFCWQCSSRYPVHREWCSVCQDGGTIIVEPVRPKSAMHSQLQVASARDLVKRKWSMVESRTYGNLLIGKGALIGVWGQPGGGKSTWVTRYVDGLPGAVLYFSAEEKLGPTLAARLERCGVTRADFHVVGQGSIDELCELSINTKATALVLDSISMTSVQPADLRRLLEASRVDVLIFIMHATKAGDPAGANTFLHEADVIIHVNAMAWSVRKSRYQALGLEGSVLDAKPISVG